MVARKVTYNITSGAVSGPGGIFSSTLLPIFRNIVRSIERPTELFEEIKKDFFRTNKQLIFSQYGGNSPFTDLAESTKKRKGTKPYPILVGSSGDLRRSLTDPNSADAVATITPKSLLVGTRVEYATYHQQGTSRMPSRPPVQLGDERINRWISMADKYIDKAVERA